MNLEAGALDEGVDSSGAVHIRVTSALPGIVIPAAATSFPGEPL